MGRYLVYIILAIPKSYKSWLRQIRDCRATLAMTNLDNPYPNISLISSAVSDLIKLSSVVMRARLRLSLRC